MGINFKCPYINEAHTQVLSKCIVEYFCEKKGHSIKSCPGCRVKTEGNVDNQTFPQHHKSARQERRDAELAKVLNLR